VRDHCRQVIDGVARDGGYIMDASAIMQNDTKPDNLRALTDYTREYGVYASGHSEKTAEPPPMAVGWTGDDRQRPGVCLPWEAKREEIPRILGDPSLVKRIWEEVDALGSVFIWQCLVSF